MELKFTLRIGEVEEERLDALRKITGEKTNTGAIKYIIRSFEKLNYRYKNEIEKNRVLEKKIIEIKQRTDNFLAAFEELKSI